MTFPLYARGFFGASTGYLIGTLVGIAFGFVLERAGFGRARNLAAQFYLTDLRVLKVMFTAIATALVGMALLSGVGVLDLARLTVPETFLWPQLAGGLLLGAGFIISGYCPGTAAVATASGNLDGAVGVAGMMAGSLVFGFAFAPIEKFYGSGALGVVRLTDLLGIHTAVAAVAVLAMAIGAFVGGEQLERIFAARSGEGAPESPRPIRARVFRILTSAAVLSLLALALPAGKPPAAKRLAGSIEPVDLARQLVADPEGVWLLDLRLPEATSRGRIPGAMTLSSDDPSGFRAADLAPTRKLVLYAQGDVAAIPRGLLRFPGEILALRGGYDAWRESILVDPEAPASPTPVTIAEFRIRSALHSRFTGAAAAEPPKLEAKPLGPPAAGPRKGGGC